VSSMRISNHYDLKCSMYSKNNTSQKVVKKGSAKMVAQFRVGLGAYFG
jgi:hypothetical protein